MTDLHKTSIKINNGRLFTYKKTGHMYKDNSLTIPHDHVLIHSVLLHQLVEEQFAEELALLAHHPEVQILDALRRAGQLQGHRKTVQRAVRHVQHDVISGLRGVKLK